MAEKPTAAFVLSLIGAILILIDGLWIAIAFSILGGLSFMMPGFDLAWLGGMFLILAVVAIILGVLTLIGAMMMNTTNKDKVRTGSILVLVFSIISLIGGGGFIIGFILCLVGSILGLTWKPMEAPPTPPPP
ncbi:MAG: hypothetical protein HXX80_00565 [Nitrososphaerales archaeon]|nr:hypothetical protein [Nitrososphaerales archaeon]